MKTVAAMMVESSNLSSSTLCLLMSEFDDEEAVISQYSSQTKWCFGRDGSNCIGLKS